MDFRELAKQYYDNYLADLSDLVAIESVRDKEHAAPGMPFGPNPAKALDTMLAMAQRDGFKTKNYEGYAGTVEYGDGEETVGILGHLDVVPLGDGWTKDPLKVTRENGCLYGRGVLDDKGPTLAAYYAMKMIADAGIDLKRKVMLIAGCDEESGMECMKYYTKNGPIPDLGFTPDADFPVIYGEKGNIHLSLLSDEKTVIKKMEAGTRPNIVIQHANAWLDTDKLDLDLFDFYLRTHGLKGKAEKTDDGVHLYMEGIPAHGSMPYDGVNAGVHLFNYIAQAYDDMLSANYYSLIHDWKGTGLDIEKNGRYMGFLTMNPGIIRVEDGKASVLLDIRYPNDDTVEEIVSNAKRACETKTGGAVTVRLDSAGKPLFVDPNSKLVKDLMASYAKYTGDTFSPAITIGGGTYAKEFENFVAFGPEKNWVEAPRDFFLGGPHQRDEGIREDDLIEAMAIYADAIVRLAS